MYKVPLIINQRDVIIALHPSDLPTKNVAIDTFVVDNTELLRFYKKILALDYDGPLSNDYILNISAISREEDAITVEFTTFKQGGIAYSQDGLELTNDHYCYLRLKQFPNEATRFHIHLIVKINEIQYEGDVYVVVADKHHIYDAVFDFGSEASQILCHARDKELGINDIMPLYGKVKHSYGKELLKKASEVEQGETNIISEDLRKQYREQMSKSNKESEEIDDSEIIQHDDSDRLNRLYKSIYYAPGTLLKEDFRRRTDEPTNQNFIFFNKGEDIPVFEKNNYFVMPNLKVAQYGGVVLPMINSGQTVNDHLSHYRRVIMNFFIRMILDTVSNILDDEEEDSYDDEKEYTTHRAINLIVLVPNSYTQEVVTKMLKDLRCDITKLLAEEKYKSIIGCEISTFSESDASFLGMMTQHQDILINTIGENKNILTIDVGKGTTDFSVVQTRQKGFHWLIEEKYRSGFIGAGNVISFALYANLLAHLFQVYQPNATDLQIKQRVEEYTRQITDPDKKEDRNYLSLLIHIIEKYKKIHTSVHATNSEKNWRAFMSSEPKNANLDEIKLSTIVEAFAYCEKKKSILGDDYGYIANAVNAITTKFEKEIDSWNDRANLSIEYVILAGRGMLFPELRTQIEEMIRRKFSEKCTILTKKNVSVGTVKNFCLFGPLNTSLIYDGNMDMVGWPTKYELKNGTNEMDDQDETKGHKPTSKFKRIFEIYKGIRGDSENPDSESDSISEVYTPTIQKEPKEITEDREITYNDELCSKTLLTPNSRYLIGGKYYIIKIPRYTNIKNEEAVSLNVFFDGERFVARSNDGCFYFEPAGAELQDNLVFETQFPYVTADNEGEISVLKGSEETSVAAAKPSEDNDMKTNSSSQDNGKGIPPADIEDDV